MVMRHIVAVLLMKDSTKNYSEFDTKAQTELICNLALSILQLIIYGLFCKYPRQLATTLMPILIGT